MDGFSRTSVHSDRLGRPGHVLFHEALYMPGQRFVYTSHSNVHLFATRDYVMEASSRFTFKLP